MASGGGSPSGFPRDRARAGRSAGSCAGACRTRRRAHRRRRARLTRQVRELDDDKGCVGGARGPAPLSSDGFGAAGAGAMSTSPPVGRPFRAAVPVRTPGRSTCLAARGREETSRRGPRRDACESHVGGGRLEREIGCSWPFRPGDERLLQRFGIVRTPVIAHFTVPFRIPRSVGTAVAVDGPERRAVRVGQPGQLQRLALEGPPSHVCVSSIGRR